MSPNASSAARRLLVPALCVTALAGCGAPAPALAPELVTGTAPTGQQPVTLLDYQPGSVADGDEWPRACELITEAEVLAVLPQATQVMLEGRGETFDYQVVPIGGYDVPHSPNPYANSREIDVAEKDCDISMRLPADDEDGVYATVDVSIDMVGSPDTVSYFFDPYQPQPMPDQFGAEECVEEGNAAPDVHNVFNFACRKGRMSIEVTGVLTIDEEDQHVRLAGQPTHTDPALVFEWYRTEVVPQFVGVAARRMP